MALTNKQITVIFKALCDENRVQICRILQNGELCACHLLEVLHLSQPTLSHHMKILCDSGLVVGRKEGKWMHYSISPEGTAIAMDCLKELTAVSGNDQPCCHTQ
ncbi:MAG: metalloregulator ArsR/SmtB family transcription factor [Oscillospiraceae bacterium]|nr:metalloregulator ArsR/SmtB family transcription factor [Oscillospiraceae bacterium]